MKIKPNYIIIPLIAIVVAIFGYIFSVMGMDWYKNELIKPETVFSDLLSNIIWIGVFIFATVSALITWNKRYVENKFLLVFRKKEIDVIFLFVVGLFAVNALFNMLWVLLFFVLHQISLAFFEMFILELTILIVMSLLWKRSKAASLFMLPYFAWIAFVMYNTLQIIFLN